MRGDDSEGNGSSSAALVGAGDPRSALPALNSGAMLCSPVAASLCAPCPAAPAARWPRLPQRPSALAPAVPREPLPEPSCPPMLVQNATQQTAMLARLGGSLRPTLASPVPRSAFVRSLRQCAPALQSDVTTRGQISSVSANDASKFVESETLAQHQQRVRHDNPANRTFNYALLGVLRIRGPGRGRAVTLPPCAQAAHDLLRRAPGGCCWSSFWRK